MTDLDKEFLEKHGYPRKRSENEPDVLVAALPAGEVEPVGYVEKKDIERLKAGYSAVVYVSDRDSIGVPLYPASALTAMQRERDELEAKALALFWAIQPNAIVGDIQKLRDRATALQAAEAENARLKVRLAEAHRVMKRIQASDDWHYRDIPVVEWANKAEGYEAALEVIAGSHWERVGYCQSDVEDVPDLTAIEAQSHARAALQRFRRARSFSDGGSE